MASIERLERLFSAIAKGPVTFNELCRRSKIHPRTVRNYIKIIEQRPGKKHRKEVSFELHDLKLSEEEKITIDILRGGEMTSSELYEAFMAKKNMTKRQIRNYLMLLEAKGVVDSKEMDYGTNTFLKIKIYSLKPQGAG